MQGYNELNSESLDSAFNDVAQQQYKCHWEEVYSKISKQNSYSNVLKQVKPNMEKKFKTYSSPKSSAKSDDDELLTQLAKKLKPES